MTLQDRAGIPCKHKDGEPHCYTKDLDDGVEKEEAVQAYEV